MRQSIRQVVVALLCVVAVSRAHVSAAQQSATTSVVTAADAFLSTLTTQQRQAVVYAFTDDAQRKRWSNFPTGVVPRGGMSLKQMTPTQRTAAMHLMAVVLSPMGLQKVNEVRQADDDFKANGSKRGPGGGGPRQTGANGAGGPPPDGVVGPPQGPGGPPAGANGNRGSFNPDDLFGSDLYYISFVGAPSRDKPWMLQFGGHHLALNITMAGGEDVLTPTLTGAQPARFVLNGKVVRPVGRESDKALVLVQSLDNAQRAQAVLPYTVEDLVLGPGQDGKQIAPEGLKVSAMTEKQKALLVDLIAEWAGILNQPAADRRLQQLKADLNATWFAWSGPTTGALGQNITAYYRIQGPHLVIEYAPQRDEPGNHVHTIYRDPTNDYGQALLRQ